MIPLKIQIKNFISYGSSQTLDFGPYPLICLSGKNGHGKSALLDALTWALWGQARKVSGVAKADDGLLHLGQTNMVVSLDFMCASKFYRVRREYTVLPGKSYTTLDFGILDSDFLRPLTDKTIRATQEKIETTLGLDYETFINSAFLRQGQSHEFSKKTAKERKDILANILGLEHFERMRRLALDKIKEAVQKKDQSTALIERLQNELSEKPQVLTHLQEVSKALVEHAEKEGRLQKKLSEVAEKLIFFAAQKATLEKIEFQKNHIVTHLEKLIQGVREESTLYRKVLAQSRTQGSYSFETERTTLQQELQNIQVLASQKISLQQLYTAKQEHVRNYVQAMQDRYKEDLDKIQLTAHTLTNSLTSAKQKKAELEKKKEALSLELTALGNEIIKLTQSIEPVNAAVLETLSSLQERHKAYYHAFTSKAQSLTAQLSSLEQKKKLMQTQETALCPLCDQTVCDTSALHAKFESQSRLFSHQIARLSKVLTTLKKIIVDDHASIETLKKKSEHQKLIGVKIGELQKNKEKIEREITTIGQELTTQHEIFLTIERKQLQSSQEKQNLDAQFKAAQEDTSWLSMQHEMRTIGANLEKNAYNPEREKHIHGRLQELSVLATQQSAFIKEQALQENRKQSILEKCIQARVLAKQKKELTQTIEELAPLKDLEKETVITQEYTQMTLRSLLEQKEILIHQKGALEAKLTTLKIREEECKREEVQAKVHATLAEEYGAVATALSKDGIQALLIEDALPEIEHEANNLLAKLTDNQAHLSIESLRDLKSGNTKETLDIKISDAAGIRPYELFSGGEAFRIDFALRIALSKLLAKRSGTPLQTLIIDEGFGSQDEEGLAHIVDALIRIQDDFAKIIVVSHLPTLKEQFPVHFHVQKTSQGSTVTVIEQC